MTTLQSCLDDLLIRGLDDWIQAAEVASVVRTTGATTSEAAAREMALRLIRTLLDAGLCEVGMVEEQRGFIRWMDSIADSMQRIEAAWGVRPTGPDLGEVCWLSLTAEGKAQAQRLWSRKSGGDAQSSR